MQPMSDRLLKFGRARLQKGSSLLQMGPVCPLTRLLPPDTTLDSPSPGATFASTTACLPVCYVLVWAFDVRLTVLRSQVAVHGSPDRVTPSGLPPTQQQAFLREVHGGSWPDTLVRFEDMEPGTMRSRNQLSGFRE